MLWVQAAAAGKPWLGLCDCWRSYGNQVRWQTLRVPLGRRVWKGHSLPLHGNPQQHSTAGERRSGTLSLLIKGFVNWKGRSGGYNEGTGRIPSKKPTQNSRGFWQQCVVLRASTTKVTRQISHIPLGWCELLTLPSNLLKKFSQIPSSGDKCSYSCWLPNLPPPPTCYSSHAGGRQKGRKRKSLTWLSWISVTEN